METVKNFLSLDVGSTCCKAQVFDDRGNILFYRSRECPLLKADGREYADIGLIADTVKSLIREAGRAAHIRSLAFSSFGESFVLLDKRDEILTLPMLYTDPRGKEQAERVAQKFGKSEIYRLTGVVPHAMYSVYKLLYVMERMPEKFAAADKLFLIGDYFGYLLTGKRVVDYALAARTGAFDLRAKKYAEDFLRELNIPLSLFSEPAPSGSVVGKIVPEVADALNLPRDCSLVLGSHDQVCAALGAGATRAGDAVDGMGTVECITAVFKDLCGDARAGEQGFPIVPFAVDGLYCTYICNYASGSIVNWFKNGILHNYKGDAETVFSYLESGMTESPSGIYTLPYFAGAAIPYQDTNARGAVVGLTTSTTDSMIYQSIMEAQAMEMKFETSLAKRYGINVKSAVATGGGANSGKWLQIKADIQGIPYYTLRSSEGGLCGCAVLQAVAVGGMTLQEAVATFVKKKDCFTPDKERGRAYEGYYRKYKKLYRALKEFN